MNAKRSGLKSGNDGLTKNFHRGLSGIQSNIDVQGSEL